MSLEPLTPFGNALAGALGGVFSSAVVYPLDTVKTRIQAGVDEQQSKSASGTVKKLPGSNKPLPRDTGLFTGVIRIARSPGGPKSLYKGFAANMLNTFSTQFAYFYWYSVVRTLYMDRILPSAATGSGKAAVKPSTAAELMLGAVAGALAQLFTIPVSVIATRQQIGGSSSSKSQAATMTTSRSKAIASSSSEDDSFVAVAKDIFKQDGITGFWRGLKPSLVLTVNPAITYGVFERVKTIILAASADGKMTPGKSFLVGALSKTLATVVTFPYILSKIRLQARSTPYSSAFEVLGDILRKRGIAGWYQGMQAQIIKAVLSQALLFFFRDYFELWTRQLMRAGKKAAVVQA
ncbi:unnamed protein product [Tilletia controversa]|uniref:Mitochondrial carrier n=3 Tax=Tilletia TaxID=13289 RepID=A0A8X7SZ96_9BASI|nr:hypothetical protein CF336_g4080 [Tilletia laevis]KAE8201481.1 hypothetical protein CF328_g2667 [Tilletia controversa]KAE8247043.1 hypothetical protein A4X03_0g7156 [Tilletia caries]KAE8202727.1 hypothetical protein CF335_g3302 [Tilletia laevis]KAE8252791.1 hypothetical protein A4X06_0g1924 [Tilletia controversa]